MQKEMHWRIQDTSLQLAINNLRGKLAFWQNTVLAEFMFSPKLHNAF